MKKVLHILPSNRFSGAENVVCQIICMFQDRDREFEMTYCCPDGPIRQALQQRNIQFIPLVRMSILEIRRVINQVKPDIIHAHDMKASFFVALACGRTPMISHVHNNNFDARRPTPKAILYLCAALKAKHIFWVSQSSLEEYCFQKWVKKRSTFLQNIINPQETRAKAIMANNQDVYDIVYVGRLTYQKNPQRLIAVIKRIVDVIPNIKVAIVGSGDLEEETISAVEKAGLNHCVNMLGFMANPLGILGNSKLMLMVSRWEGTPMCALESMAVGVPIVSTPTDGLSELIMNGKTGYLSNDDEELANKCIQLIKDSELRERMSQMTSVRANEIMDMDTYVSRIKQIYEQALN